MATTKRKRRYAQDFSKGGKTDASFAPSCDVNRIVNHYQKTGIDIHADRLQQARYGEAPTLTYAEAMRYKAELDSTFALLPLSDQEKYDFSVHKWISDLSAPKPAHDLPTAADESPAEPVPQDASDGKSEA